jgi:hypothetical protein
VLAVSSLGLFGLGCVAWLTVIVVLIAAFLLRRTLGRRHARALNLVLVSAITVGMALAMLVPLLTLPLRQAGLFWLGYFGAMVVFEFVFHVARGVYGARHPGSGPDLFGPPGLREERLRSFDRMTRHAKWFGIYGVGLGAVFVVLAVFLLVAAFVQSGAASVVVSRQEVVRAFAREGIHLRLSPPKQSSQPWLALGPVRGGGVQVVIADRRVSLPSSLSGLRSGGGPRARLGAEVVNNLLIQWRASPQVVRRVMAAVAVLRRQAHR